ncbi:MULTISPECIES: hypothetical protein [Peptoniphilus]|uniref:hypothetical protein n=1 Tax=Peptoniphilus TaxID=162289 RepID=UPI0001DA9A1A|nr:MULTISPECIES: hypothetical protein [Peptoniphilus]EFI41844.1 hypothetical protein HMPREF0629_00473 [Peptoniphilus sp. oral taxon 386 str. F0131]
MKGSCCFSSGQINKFTILKEPNLSVRKISYDLALIDKLRGKLNSVFAPNNITISVSKFNSLFV